VDRRKRLEGEVGELTIAPTARRGRSLPGKSRSGIGLARGSGKSSQKTGKIRLHGGGASANCGGLGTEEQLGDEA
jgi:hypothetical protein